MGDQWYCWAYQSPYSTPLQIVGYSGGTKTVKIVMPQRIEIVRPRADQYPHDCTPELVNLDNLRPETNITGLWWRPTY